MNFRGYLRKIFANQKNILHFANPISQNHGFLLKNAGIFAAYLLQLSCHNFSKKNVMRRLNKIICTAFITAVSTSVLPAVSYAGEVKNTVTVYAGPQSVSPNQPIFVTVEATDKKAESLMNETVELSYKADGKLRTMRAKTARGLALFEIPAQTKAGLMTFVAAVKGTTSKTARVLVTASAPQAFTFTVKRTQQPEHITITSIHRTVPGTSQVVQQRFVVNRVLGGQTELLGDRVGQWLRLSHYLCIYVCMYVCV